MATGALGRAGKGAGIGAAAGYMNEGDVTGTLSGAAFGAAAGVVGGGAMAHYGGPARIARRGMGAIGRRAKGRQAALGGLGVMTKNQGRAYEGLGKMRGYMGTGASFIGQNRVNVNKWGGRAIGALGIGSAAHIGSSMIGSNNGY